MQDFLRQNNVKTTLCMRLQRQVAERLRRRANNTVKDTLSSGVEYPELNSVNGRIFQDAQMIRK